MVKKQKGWIYFPVEVKVREMEAKLLLAYYAVKEGYDVVIGDHIMVELASEKYPKGIFFSKGYPHGFRRRVITNAKDNGHIIVELDEEGLLVKDKKYLRDRMRRDMLTFVRQEYCWGQFQREVITKAYPEYKEKCHTTGNPRFDLLKPKFRSIYQEEAEQLKTRFGEFILINTRFSLYNTVKGMKDNVHFKHIKSLYYHFLEMIKATCEQFPYTNIVIRPHPGENFESYRKTFAKYSNVHVIHEGNIIKWLLAAKAIIHNGCTSGIEGYLLGKPVISYVPYHVPDSADVLPNQLGEKATNIEQLHKVLTVELNRKCIDTNSNDNVKCIDNLFNYCEWSQDTFAYDAILRLCNTIVLAPSKPIKYPKTIHSSQIKSKKKRKRRFSLTELEIEEFFEKLHHIEDDDSIVKIKEIGKNVFHIQTE
ncbi:surface carbohydrate biosynthesis protein [Ornithinibacillus salinisoli]|uniref:Surface carbohydrate biosynthesis protein n=1 Tax=Ornithinibacillus salinisoli TaxID=1848459 RepID=A0ABW4W8J2_9BACI